MSDIEDMEEVVSESETKPKKKSAAKGKGKKKAPAKKYIEPDENDGEEESEDDFVPAKKRKTGGKGKGKAKAVVEDVEDEDSDADDDDFEEEPEQKPKRKRAPAKPKAKKGKKKAADDDDESDEEEYGGVASKGVSIHEDPKKWAEQVLAAVMANNAPNLRDRFRCLLPAVSSTLDDSPLEITKQAASRFVAMRKRELECLDQRGKKKKDEAEIKDIELGGTKKLSFKPFAHVMSFLEHRTAFKTQTVNKTWKKACYALPAFRHFDMRHRSDQSASGFRHTHGWAETLNFLDGLKYGRLPPIKALTFRGGTKIGSFKSMPGILLDLDWLDLSAANNKDPDYTELGAQFPCLRGLATKGSSWEGGKFQAITKAIPSLEALSYKAEGSFLKATDIATTVQLQNLRRLRIEDSTDGGYQYRGKERPANDFDDYSKAVVRLAKMPNLTHLVLGNAPVSGASWGKFVETREQAGLPPLKEISINLPASFDKSKIPGKAAREKVAASGTFFIINLTQPYDPNVNEKGKGKKDKDKTPTVKDEDGKKTPVGYSCGNRVLVNVNPHYVSGTYGCQWLMEGAPEEKYTPADEIPVDKKPKKKRSKIGMGGFGFFGGMGIMMGEYGGYDY